MSPKRWRKSQYGDDSHDKFNAPGQAGKGLILLEDLCWLTLAWFFTFSNADIRFAERKFVWRTYTAANNQVSSIRDLVLENKNVPVTSPTKYADHTNVFSADSTAAVLPEHIGIKDHPIDLVDNKQPSYALPSHPLVL